MCETCERIEQLELERDRERAYRVEAWITMAQTHERGLKYAQNKIRNLGYRYADGCVSRIEDSQAHD